jgi:hypothetical protein
MSVDHQRLQQQSNSTNTIYAANSRMSTTMKTIIRIDFMMNITIKDDECDEFENRGTGSTIEV